VQDVSTIICVFQSTQGLGSGTLFCPGAGQVNGEVPGVMDDFGPCLFANVAIPHDLKNYPFTHTNHK